MENKSRFKECPRCGLRNKTSVAQCDFCGLEFQETSEEWISQVQVLEKLNKQTESILLDDKVSKRIESTIVRSGRELETTQPPTPLEIPRVEEEKPLDSELKNKGKDWTVSNTQIPSTPSPESKEVKAFVDTMIGEPTKIEDSAGMEVSDNSTSAMATAPMSPVEEIRQSPTIATFATKTPLISYGLIFCGINIYLATLIIFALSIVPLLLGWSLAIVGAMLITIGTSYVYDRSAFKRKRFDSTNDNVPIEEEELVLICPSCNGEVEASDRHCPACGAIFAK
jgi:RNA polymerase subunit RPABC4/transcription elongation factor Spt4